MIEVLLLVVALGTLATFAVAMRIASDLRALRAEHIPDLLVSLGKVASLLDPNATFPFRPAPYTYKPLNVAVPPFNHVAGTHKHLCDDIYATWEWRDGSWQLIVESVPAAVDLGGPPTYSGAFPGERVKTWIRGEVG